MIGGGSVLILNSLESVLFCIVSLALTHITSIYMTLMVLICSPLKLNLSGALNNTITL